MERDTSNREQAAATDTPSTIRGAVFAKGLGVDAVSDVEFYLGGNCTQLTATVGIDDEVAPNGSATFSAVGDGKPLTSAPVLTGASAPLALDIDVTWVQQPDLVVGDGGNAHDHFDWTAAQPTCATG